MLQPRPKNVSNHTDITNYSASKMTKNARILSSAKMHIANNDEGVNLGVNR